MNRRRSAMTLAAACALLLALVLPAAAHTNGAGFGPGGGRPFAATSAWNSPIPANPTIDPGSAAMVANLSAVVNGKYRAALLYEFGIPIWTADRTYGTRLVDCTSPWGACQLETAGQVPLTSAMTPHVGSDGAMVVVDYAKGDAYEYWQYNWNNGVPRTSWGGVTSNVHDGDGRGSGATGAGVSRLAGVVRVHEMQAGVIPHALVFSTSFCGTGEFRFPATKTDGKYSGAGKVPEGARVQLDPSINVDAIPGITAAEKMVARALQTYGAYNIDCGGSPMAISFERPNPGQADPYPGLGFTYDYYRMEKIPWGSLRVLTPP